MIRLRTLLTLLTISCAIALPLVVAAGAAWPQTAAVPGAPPPGASPGALATGRMTDVDCTGVRGGRPLAYRNPRYGFGMTHPSSFTLDPESVPENGDSARFWTADRQATASVMGLPNRAGQSIADLLREARQDITENSRGTVTYERARDNWFVVSGFVSGRIFYQRTFLAAGGRVVGTLWIEFPRAMRPCFEAAVTLMSLSFRHGGP